MPTVKESVCCMEEEKVKKKVEEAGVTLPRTCKRMSGYVGPADCIQSLQTRLWTLPGCRR